MLLITSWTPPDATEKRSATNVTMNQHYEKKEVSSKDIWIGNLLDTRTPGHGMFP